MGAGCYYTNDLTKDKAGFINLSLWNGEAEENDSLDFYLQDIAEILIRCGYKQDNSDKCFSPMVYSNLPFLNTITILCCILTPFIPNTVTTPDD